MKWKQGKNKREFGGENMTRGNLNIIDALIEKTKDKLDEIPHRQSNVRETTKKGISEEENYRRKLKEQEETIKSLERKLNRSKKDLDERDRKARITEEKLKKVLERAERQKKDLKDEQKVVNYLKGQNHVLEETLEQVQAEVKGYRERDVGYEEQGILTADLLLRIDEQDVQIKKLLTEKHKERRKWEWKEQNLQGHIRGANRSRKRVKNELEKVKENMKPLSYRIGVLGEENKKLREQNKILAEDMQQVRVDNHRNLNNPERLVTTLIDNLTVETFSGYADMKKLMNLYGVVRKEIKEQADYLGEDLGYVILEGSDHYFISLEEQKAYLIGNIGERKVGEGTVCRAAIYVDKPAEILEFYGTRAGRRTRKTYTQERIARINKVQQGRNQKNNLGETFFKEVHGYETLVITAKNLPKYQEYFHRYGVIDVVDPFSEGARKLKSKINKADIVIVRTDAVPHRVTDHLKETCKEKTVFTIKVKSSEIAGEIYGKSQELKRVGLDKQSKKNDR